jgi:hypothetical protein
MELGGLCFDASATPHAGVHWSCRWLIVVILGNLSDLRDVCGQTATLALGRHIGIDYVAGVSAGPINDPVEGILLDFQK